MALALALYSKHINETCYNLPEPDLNRPDAALPVSIPFWLMVCLQACDSAKYRQISDISIYKSHKIEKLKWFSGNWQSETTKLNRPIHTHTLSLSIYISIFILSLSININLLAIWCLIPWVQILHSAEEDNLSPFDLNIACLCQSIEIDNKHININNKICPRDVRDQVFSLQALD